MQTGQEDEQSLRRQIQKILFQQNRLRRGRSPRINVKQELIYFFNIPFVRNYLIQYYTKKLHTGTPCQFAGTFFLKQMDDDLIALQLDTSHHSSKRHKTHDFESTLRHLAPFFLAKGKKTCMTAAILYNMNSIHFVSFMYDETTKKLVCFDPGFNLYQNGSRVIIPVVINIFVRLGWIPDEDSAVIVGQCEKLYFGRRYGIQYNGDDPDKVDLAADAFCQSWSLFFILSCIMFRGDYSFVHSWCDIAPKDREKFIMERFFLPHVLLNETILKRFRAHLQENNPSISPDDYIHTLEQLYAGTLSQHYHTQDSKKKIDIE